MEVWFPEMLECLARGFFFSFFFKTKLPSGGGGEKKKKNKKFKENVEHLFLGLENFQGR